VKQFPQIASSIRKK